MNHSQCFTWNVLRVGFVYPLQCFTWNTPDAKASNKCFTWNVVTSLTIFNKEIFKNTCTFQK